MKSNMGLLDRGLRAAVGLGLVVAAATGFIGPWGYLGLLVLLVAAIGICPAYLPFGISTCRMRDKK